MVRNRDMSGSACTRAEQGNHRAGMVGNEKGGHYYPSPLVITWQPLDKLHHTPEPYELIIK